MPINTFKCSGFSCNKQIKIQLSCHDYGGSRKLEANSLASLCISYCRLRQMWNIIRTAAIPKHMHNFKFLPWTDKNNKHMNERTTNLRPTTPLWLTALHTSWPQSWIHRSSSIMDRLSLITDIERLHTLVMDSYTLRIARCIEYQHNRRCRAPRITNFVPRNDGIDLRPFAPLILL